MCQPVYLLVACGLELLGTGSGILAIGAYQNDGLVLVLLQFDHARGETVQRNIDRVDDMASGVVFLRTYIHHQGMLAVDQCRGLLGGDGSAGLAAFGDDQQRKYHQKGGGKPIMVAYEFDKVL